MTTNSRRIIEILLFAAVVGTPADAPAKDAETRAVTASSVFELSFEAANAWADDARLIYLENDSDLDGTGRATRWGFLYWSRERNAARAYSLNERKLVTASEPGLDFPALPVMDRWIDSDQALARAEDEGGQRYREDHAGRLESMVLVRGVFHEQHPERTTWTVVYSSGGSPPLWIVLDASSGELVRRWEG